MLIFIICFAAGVVEMILLKLTIDRIFKKKYPAAALFILLKLAVYAAAIVPTVLFFKDSVLFGALGYFLGLPICAAVFGLISLKKR